VRALPTKREVHAFFFFPSCYPWQTYSSIVCFTHTALRVSITYCVRLLTLGSKFKALMPTLMQEMPSVSKEETAIDRILAPFALG
jgi:hypothetical protein